MFARPFIMENRLTISKTQKQNSILFEFSGVIDEEADLSPLMFPGESDTLVINLRGVKRINSCGVREWIIAMDSVIDKNVQFVECSSSMINQFNLITSFCGNGQIKTFMAPYFCGTCDTEYEVSLDVEKHFPDKSEPQAPSYNCPKCHTMMEFDDIPERYLFFIKRMGKQPPSF